jgi:hypothetical protein
MKTNLPSGGHLQQAIQEEDPADHDADEEPTIVEDNEVAYSTGPKAAMLSIQSVVFDDETDNVKSEIQFDGDNA